ncbi:MULTISPECIES: CNNM family magnesium/cobalt transport protein CorC [Pasteurellaceae]|uniref:Magnesium and cobalt efflux protein CorC n=1 Tax=Pasteurella atlantica TaxID=2827233 RepID=A0AAW8CQW8_9PAST|nr:CNNM family magnesium/cobalt transport protein CorC [Pasteurella atlantica]MBR0573887.1 CNNM family magnesium/cobalt transport protein CorC [Pasteurella atlantica]MDP8039878.1 CNNM family magnesium/cobalt transport protein CorC [Pasteurella atlantica]MDP8041962.1 CNNM family magnesium/cobalt transport protein CorC [Pasteurella atlantica]MDP8044111.1 CNNM family magnesium/cobalt transport protein CorC [Pasteurella atlantica]MDP8046161.1 CNNM family magnesium/cobalt transport protein CorC [Pa
MNDKPNSAEKNNLFQRIYHRFFQKDPQNREDLVEVIRDSADNDLIDDDTKEMIEGVIEMSELRVRDIMIPRAQMVFIEAEQPLESCVDTIIETSHSRFPVIRGDKDDIEGILLAKELLKYLRSDSQPFEMKQILRPAVIIPESKRVDRMLKEFRSERFHMAIVVDEFGAVSGLVTIEDILEQIVGDIEDEFDEEEAEPIRRLSKHSYAVSALTDIEDFNEFFATDFEDEEVDTVGGLVMQAFGHLPQKGETIELEGITFKVTSGNTRRLLQVRATLSDSQLEKMPDYNAEKEEEK